MARQVRVDLSDHFEAWREKTNLLSNYNGDLTLLNTTEDSDIVGAINEAYTFRQDFYTDTTVVLANSLGSIIKTMYVYDSLGGL
jgi:hypothetical protein